MSQEPKFKAGDTIAGQLEMSDGTQEWKTFLVNRIIEDPAHGATYSLDDGNGWIDGRIRVGALDDDFEVC